MFKYEQRKRNAKKIHDFPFFKKHLRKCLPLPMLFHMKMNYDTTFTKGQGHCVSKEEQRNYKEFR